MLTLKINNWVALLFISISVLFALSLWIIATAVLPQLQEEWSLTKNESASITTAVQIGFIIGALGIAWSNLADRLNNRMLFSISAIIGAISNCLFVTTSTFEIGLVYRFLTGVALAGVYPTAVSLASQWFKNRRGTAVGIIIGALTVGSAIPHFVKTFFAGVEWHIVILTSSLLAVIAAFIIYFLLPDVRKNVQLKKAKGKAIQLVVKNRPVMLANIGYFGHMWELYAMWTWFPLFLVHRIDGTSSTAQFWSGFLAFAIIGIAGAIGSIGGGILADKIGKAKLAKWAMIVSASCAICIGLTYSQPLWLTLLVGFIWGAAVIADSAQFSALATDYAASSIVGTALAFQMAVGFFITIVSIYLLPHFVSIVGWEWAFMFLAIGPICGIFAMNRLIKEQ